MSFTEIYFKNLLNNENDFIQMINEIYDKQHYLIKDQKYFQSFINGLSFIFQATNKNEKIIEDIVNDKLKLNNTFNKTEYLQVASELTVLFYLAFKFSNSFLYEPKLIETSNKNPECQIEFEGLKYNFEVKCADFSEQEKITSIADLQFNIIGRHPEFKTVLEELKQPLREGFINTHGKIPQIINQKHMGLKMKDFLVLAHSKFPNKDDILNILVVSTDKRIDEWNSFLIGHEGLFTPNSFFDKIHYSNVDVVILSTIYNSHDNYWEKDYLIPYNLEDSFTFIHPTKECLHRKKKLLDRLFIFFPNHNLAVYNCHEYFKNQEDMDQLTKRINMEDILLSNTINYFLKDKKVI